VSSHQRLDRLCSCFQCFYINLPLDGLALAITIFFLDVKTPTTNLKAGLKAIDWAGAVLLTGATVMFLLGLEYGGTEHPWNSGIVIGLLVAGIVVFVLFFVVEAKFAKYPIIPIRLFATRSNIAILGVCFFHGIAFIGVIYYIPLYFQVRLIHTNKH
jgi:MFS family permease